MRKQKQPSVKNSTQKSHIVPQELKGGKSIDTIPSKNKLDGSELFSLFTANIIKEQALFTR